jgi:hypothetical protein
LRHGAEVRDGGAGEEDGQEDAQTGEATSSDRCTAEAGAEQVAELGSRRPDAHGLEPVVGRCRQTGRATGEGAGAAQETEYCEEDHTHPQLFAHRAEQCDRHRSGEGE